MTDDQKPGTTSYPVGILRTLTGTLPGDVLQEEQRARYAALRHAKEILSDSDGYLPDDRTLDLFEFAEYILTGRRPWGEDYDRVPQHESETVEFRNMSGDVTRVYPGDTPPVRIVSQGASVRPTSKTDPDDDLLDFD